MPVIGISEIQIQNPNITPDTKEVFIRINNSGDLLLNIINDTIYLNTIKHEEKPIEFILSVDENVPSHVFSDEIRIKKILNNLLSNAFKYTSQGEVELSLNVNNAGINIETD